MVTSRDAPEIQWPKHGVMMCVNPLAPSKPLWFLLIASRVCSSAGSTYSSVTRVRWPYVITETSGCTRVSRLGYCRWEPQQKKPRLLKPLMGGTRPASLGYTQSISWPRPVHSQPLISAPLSGFQLSLI